MEAVQLNLLVSYPRSGNTWMRYMIEYLTKQVTIGSLHNQANIIERGIGHCIQMGVNLTKPILYKQHFLKNEQLNEPIIFILRNYKEVIVKHKYQKTPKSFTKEFKDKWHNQYINLLWQFDKAKNKIFIYYEDLINRKMLPKILKEIFQFLGWQVDICSFMNEYDYHKDISIQLYKKHIGGSSTKGNYRIFHSEKLGKYRKEWDDFLEQKYPVLFNKYLLRYKE